MTDPKMPSRGAKNNGRLKSSHYGTIQIAPGMVFECAVLEDGRRGFIQRQMVQAIGFAGGDRSARFGRFCEKIGLNALNSNVKSECPVLEVDLKHGGTAQWVPETVLTDVIRAGMVAHSQGKLTKQQEHIGRRCVEIGTALIGVALVALIDEATGYQHVREPDALQDLYGRLIRETEATWERRFHPEYYRALCGLFGFQYGNRHRPLPSIIGRITETYVYHAVFPKEIVDEIKRRKTSGKLHQWLTAEGGLKLLDRQVTEVTAIARSSIDYRDFEARCSQAFYKPGQQLSMIYPQGTAA